MKKTFLYAALAMMLAACSNDDTLQNGSAETDGMVPVTLSVTADNSVATSRADNNNGDLAPTRCFVQICDGQGDPFTSGDFASAKEMYNNASGTFSLDGVYLNPNESYVFLFWADNAPEDATDVPTNLTDVTYVKDRIAFAKRKEWRYDGTNAAISEQLTHAVAKVTLKTTTDLAASSNISVALQHCYDTYDVSTGAVSGESSDKTFSTTVSTDITGSDDGTEVFSFYALTGEGTQEVSVKNGDNGDKASNVPLGPDKHTTLVGDVLYVGLTPVTFTASVDEDWTDGGTVHFSPYTYDEATKTYTVYTAEGLLAWNTATQSDKSINCTLAADIDMTGQTWTPIGTIKYTGIQGTFDGAGHTISNLTVGSNLASGLIGCLGENGIVKNLIIKDANITGRSQASGIVGYNCGKIIGCAVVSLALISASQLGSAGGIVGLNEGSITACYSTTVTVTGSNAGAILGSYSSSSSPTPSACYWSNDALNKGVGSGNDTTTKVDDSSTTWTAAMDGMNAQLTANDYQWTSNVGDDKDTLPLKLQRKN